MCCMFFNNPLFDNSIFEVAGYNACNFLIYKYRIKLFLLINRLFLLEQSFLHEKHSKYNQ